MVNLGPVKTMDSPVKELHIAPNSWAVAIFDQKISTKKLLELGVDPNRSTGERYPLHQAVDNGNVQQISKLLDRGVNVNKYIEKTMALILIAVRAGNEPLVFLFERGVTRCKVSGTAYKARSGT